MKTQCKSIRAVAKELRERGELDEEKYSYFLRTIQLRFLFAFLLAFGSLILVYITYSTEFNFRFQSALIIAIKSSWMGAVFICVILTVCFVGLVHWIYQRESREFYLHNNGKTTTGKILSIHHEKHWHQDTKITYSFIKDNEEVIQKEVYNKSFFEKVKNWKSGDEIQVVYLQNGKVSPRISILNTMYDVRKRK